VDREDEMIEAAQALAEREGTTALRLATTCTRPAGGGARIKWMFTTNAARAKLARAYPDPTKES